MVAFTSRKFWLTLLAFSLATAAAAPVDSPVYSPQDAPEPKDELKYCISKCLEHFKYVFPSCAGRFTHEEYSPKTYCHAFGYICLSGCNYCIY
ncbi:hypothetical protein BG003_009490 [Podila horticola]|nr:hypothetical protein BG003_009490 [Podila horticola]